MWGSTNTRRYLGSFAGALVVAVFVFGAVSVAGGAETAEEQQPELNGSGTAADPYVITSASELQAMDKDLTAHYVLGTDINATETSEWNNGLGFSPIGDEKTAFEGTFDGQNHTISNLMIERPRKSNVGLFGFIDEEGQVQNFGLENVDFRGYGPVGGVAGHSEGTVRSVMVEGRIDATHSVAGGVVGELSKEPEVQYAVSSSRVTGNLVGGIVGRGTIDGVVESSYSTGSLEANAQAGGLVGDAAHTVRSSYSAARVEATNIRGAVIGQSLTRATITGLYWNPQDAGVDEGIGYEQGSGAELRELTRTEMRGPSARQQMSPIFDTAGFVPTDEYPVFERHVVGLTVSVADSPIAVDETTNATVILELLDGSTVTASQTNVYEFDADGMSIDQGTIRPAAPGDTEIVAKVGNQRDSTTLAIRTPSSISVSETRLSGETLLAGTSAELTVDLANSGQLAGSATVPVVLNGERIARQNVSIDGGGQETRALSFEVPPPGEYELSVGEADPSTLTVVDNSSVSIEVLQAPAEIPTVGSYTVTAVFQNENDVAVTVPIRYAVQGTEQREFVTVEPGRTTVEFTERAVGTPGETIRHEIAVLETRRIAESEVRELPEFGIESVDAVETATAGEQTSITVTLENTGPADGSVAATILFAGQNVSTQEVTVPSGETVQISVEITPDTPGTVTYAAAIPEETVSASLTVEEADDEQTETPQTPTEVETDTETEATDDDDGAGFGIAAAVLALLAGGFVARRGNS